MIISYLIHLIPFLNFKITNLEISIYLLISITRIFLLSTQKEALICDMLGPEDSWNLQFRRPLFDWELSHLENLMHLLDGVSINSRADCLTWSWNPNLTFSVNSVYNEWEKRSFQENSDLNCIWRNLCPAKIEIFAWLALQNKILPDQSLQDITLLPLARIHAFFLPLRKNHLSISFFTVPSLGEFGPQFSLGGVLFGFVLPIYAHLLKFDSQLPSKILKRNVGYHVFMPLFGQSGKQGTTVSSTTGMQPGKTLSNCPKSGLLFGSKV